MSSATDVLQERRPTPVPDAVGVEPDVGGASRRNVFIALGVALAAANGMLAAGLYIPFISPAVGAFALLGIPTFLLYTADLARASTTSERLVVSMVLALLALMLAGLVANTVLPHVGVDEPLGGLSTILTVDLLCVTLGACVYRRQPMVYRRPALSLGGADRAVIALALLTVVLSAMGAVRLNNEAGGGLTLVMLAVALATMAVMVACANRLNPNVIALGVFLVSLGLLLMTSLRGWYTTGHDVQREFGLLQDTKLHGNWNAARYRDAYNACLSITILPTIFLRWTRVADPYVYKFFFQVLFAACPVLVFLLARRVASTVIALLATIYFVSFVTFFQDMPMLNRQEIAFLFLVAGLLAVFNPRLPLRARKGWFCIFAVGMALSHYSTTYFTIGVLVLAWGIRVVGRPLRLRRLLRLKDPGAAGHVLAFGMIMVVIAISVTWSWPLTHTQQGLTDTVTATVRSLRSASADSRSSDTSYSIFSTSTPSPAERLGEFRKASVQATADGRRVGRYPSLATVSRYSAPVAATAEVPLTFLGRTLTRFGLDVASFNNTVRQASARFLQLFIGVGVLAFAFTRRRSLNLPVELFFLTIANAVVVLAQVILPVVSVRYGLLRAFLQALLLLNVFLVIGTLAVIPRLLGRARMVVATVLALAFFASSTGIVTQLLGGYEPQLHLNNAGKYYDIYYQHPQDMAANKWFETTTARTDRYVQSEIAGAKGNVQTEIRQPVNKLSDIFPILVRRDAYVVLGYSNVRQQESTATFAGDLVTYKYPLEFLDDTKDLLYSNGSARVYR